LIITGQTKVISFHKISQRKFPLDPSCGTIHSVPSEIRVCDESLKINQVLDFVEEISAGGWWGVSPFRDAGRGWARRGKAGRGGTIVPKRPVALRRGAALPSASRKRARVELTACSSCSQGRQPSNLQGADQLDRLC